MAAAVKRSGIAPELRGITGGQLLHHFNVVIIPGVTHYLVHFDGHVGMILVPNFNGQPLSFKVVPRHVVQCNRVHRRRFDGYFNQLFHLDNFFYFFFYLNRFDNFFFHLNGFNNCFGGGLSASGQQGTGGGPHRYIQKITTT